MSCPSNNNCNFELKGLEDIVYSLKKSSQSNDSVPEQLSSIMRNISHEDLEVRLQSLTHLKTIVQQNAGTVQQLIMGTNETSDTVVTHLVSSLLKGCSVREEELLVLYGQCFGYLGAIDPGRLTFTDQHHGDSTVYTANLIDDEFTFQLLGILARSFLAPRNAQTLNFLSFTIQQILKIYSSEEDASKLGNSALWNRFPEHLRVAFTPLTSSRYVLKQQLQSGHIPLPVYRSPVGKTYSTWLYNWTGKLISQVHAFRKIFLFYVNIFVLSSKSSFFKSKFWFKLKISPNFGILWQHLSRFWFSSQNFRFKQQISPIFFLCLNFGQFPSITSIL